MKTVNIDDDLLERARDITGIAEDSVLLNEALTRLIQHEAARQISLLGGSQPDIKLAPRRRWQPDGTFGRDSDPG